MFKIINTARSFQKPGALILHGTRDPKPRTLKERPGTPMIGETRDPKLTSFVEPWTQEL